jgi:hypothetical protein
MGYSNNMQNVTPLHMLPDLEDLETGRYDMRGDDSFYGSGLPPGKSEQIGKYIRNNNHVVSNQSGMTPIGKERSLPEKHLEPAIVSWGDPISSQENNLKTFNMPIGTPSCLDVAEHIANCPICSKFYNTDKTIYIIAIVALAIICILLLKKILDV